MIKIGQNAGIFANKAALDFYIGPRVAAVRKALRELADAKLLVDQLSNPELVTLGYDGGGDGNSNEVNYLRTALLAGDRLDKVRRGIDPLIALPHDFDAELRYAAI